MTSLLLLAAALWAVETPKLAPCPKKPNCVSSQEAGEHAIEPLRYGGDPVAAWGRMKAALATLPRVTIVSEEPGRLKAVAVTKVLRFRDDMEFLMAEPRRIEVRSASRMGHSDLGANRERVEALRKAFEAQP